MNAIIEISKFGTIELALDEKNAPISVANFVSQMEFAADVLKDLSGDFYVASLRAEFAPNAIGSVP